VADKLRVVIAPDGSYQFVYSDALAPLVQPHSVMQRASHVEPCGACRRCGCPLARPGFCECGGEYVTTGWTADMAPVGGPLLGPFKLRADALAAEREWLSRTWGL